MDVDYVVCGAPEYFAARSEPASPDELVEDERRRFPLSSVANERRFERDGKSASVRIATAGTA